MIDSLIIHRQIDHKEEIKQGLNLGLWTTDARSADFESANTKKRSWSVFKYMDSSRSASETAFIPSTIGVSNWKSLIPSYSSKLYNKSNCTIGALEQVSAYRRGASIYQSWSPYGAVTTSHKTGNTFTALHDIRRNKNSLWGFSQKMKRSLSFKFISKFLHNAPRKWCTEWICTDQIAAFTVENISSNVPELYLLIKLSV